MYHLLTEAHRRRNADQRQRRHRECTHGPWHASADAVELADLGLVRGGVDRAGGEEQRDLADSVSGDVQRRADQRQRRQQRRSHHHVRQLADGGVRQPTLQVVGAERDHGRRNDREAGDGDQPIGARSPAQRLSTPKMYTTTLTTLKTPAFTTATACSSAETGVGATIAAGSQRWNGIKAALAMPNTHRANKPTSAASSELAPQNATGHEVGGSRDVPDAHQRRQQQHDRRAEQDAQVRAPALARFRRAVVRDQRVGDQREQFVEDEQREQVRREGDAHRRSEGQREAHVEPRLVSLVIAPHVADGVQRIDDPQSGGDEREQHAQRLDLEGELQPWHHGEQRQFGPRTADDRWQQREHAGEQRDRGDAGDRLAQVGQPPRACDQHRADRGHQQRERDGLSGRVHQRGPPSRCIAACAADPTVNSVFRPKPMEASTSRPAGTAMLKGILASAALSRRGSRKYAASTNRHT